MWETVLDPWEAGFHYAKAEKTTDHCASSLIYPRYLKYGCLSASCAVIRFFGS